MAFSIHRESIEGTEAFVLRYVGSGIGDDQDIAVKVSPELGSNLYALQIGSHHVIHYNPAFSLTSYYTGNPILYPFPNRLRNCMYEYQGEKRWQMKHGIPIFLHSLVFDECWDYTPPVIDQEGIVLDTFLSIDEHHPIYVGFPYAHVLHVIYRLTKKGLSIVYRVENHDSKTMPYGISFHTFFTKLDGDEDSLIKVPARYMMELTDDLLPTGVLLPVAGRPFDLRTPVNVGSQDLDNCFTGLIDDERLYVEYRKRKLRVFMDSTDLFTHVQVFTPQGRPFFCVERQTSSTDSPNLHARGFVDEAHLLEVEPGGSQEGQVDFRYEFFS